MLRSLFLVGAMLGLHGPASADVINIDYVQNDLGVFASGGGSFDTTGLTLAVVNFDASTFTFVNSAQGGFGLGNEGNADAYEIAATVRFGTLGPITTTPGTGDVFGIVFSVGPLVMVPTGYVSQDPLSFTAAFLGRTFATLGITARGTVPITAGQNTINLTFSVAEVPVPPAIALLGAAFLAFGAAARRRPRPA